MLVKQQPHQPYQQGPGPDASLMYVVYQGTQVYPEFVQKKKNTVEPLVPCVIFKFLIIFSFVLPHVTETLML